MDISATMRKFYHPAWLSKLRADALMSRLADMTYREYAYRASVLKRAPKREFFVPFENGSRPLYRWGQSRSEYESGLPLRKFPELDEVRERIALETDECCNHCIVIEYSDGDKHHAPPHHDRQQGVPGSGAHDMVADTSFFVLTLGFPRPFQLLDSERNVVWETRLPHGSLLQVTAEMNRDYFHAVPRDPAQPGNCPRYSAIFRTIGAGASQK